MLELSDKSLFREQAYINGEWVGSGPDARLTTTNPYDGAAVGTVPKLQPSDTRRAIEGAERAFQSWKRKSADERAGILRRWLALIGQHREDLAKILTTEQGKPLREALGEIDFAASFIDWFAEEGKRIYGDTIPMQDSTKRAVVIKQPVGVCAAITPWNFPAAMITRYVGAALAAGCTVVVKPAEQTPHTALALAELGARAGIPPGVLNILTGDPAAIGQELLANPTVRKLTFTGSTEVGKLLMRGSADTLKRVSLELGGNAPFLIFDDADLDAAVEAVVACKFRNAGQTCVCANRILVQDGIYDEFAAKLTQQVGALKVGNGMTPQVDQGPLIDQAAIQKVEAHVADAMALGARVAVGGNRHKLGGTFYEPTVLLDVDPRMKISREETFGPVAPLFRFRSEEDAIQMANDTVYGLVAYFFSRDIGRVWRVSEALEYGMVGVNTGHVSVAPAPFGGVKQSGLGREGSKYGIEEYLEIKYICMGGIGAS